MYTVKQISELTGISSHTIRFYDKEGLFPFVSRNNNNVRLFGEDKLDWVNMIHCLRDTGMSLADIRRYIALSEEGNSTADERFQIILQQKEKAEQDLIAVQKRIEILSNKVEFYKTLTKDKKGEFLDPVNHPSSVSK